MILIEPPLTDLVFLTDQARDYARQSKANSTLRAYPFDWTHFTNGAAGTGDPPFSTVLNRPLPSLQIPTPAVVSLKSSEWKKLRRRSLRRRLRSRR